MADQPWRSSEAEIGAAVWDQTYGEATKGLGNPEGSYLKNPVHIGDHIDVLKTKGHTPASLERLCVEIIKFAAGVIRRIGSDSLDKVS